MSDLVTHLREHIIVPGGLFERAANRIEDLERELAGARALHQSAEMALKHTAEDVKEAWRENAALRAVAKDAKDALIDNNWDRIAARHLITRIDAALGECHSQDTAQPVPEVYQERIPLAEGCLLVTHDNRVWHYVNGERVAEVTSISLTKPHMEGNGNG